MLLQYESLWVLACLGDFPEAMALVSTIIISMLTSQTKDNLPMCTAMLLYGGHGQRCPAN